MWILGFRRLSTNTFATDCDQNCRIVRLIRDGTRFAILNPKIRPVIVDLESKRSSIDLDIASKIFRDIEAVFFSVQQNYDATLVSILRRIKPDFRAGAPAFGRASNLFFGRLAECKDRFLKLDFFSAFARLRNCALLWTARRSVPTKIRYDAALELNICQADRKISVLRAVGEQPAIEVLVHYGSRNRKMERGRTTVGQRFRIQLSFYCGSVIDDL